MQHHYRLSDVTQSDDFLQRHIGISESDFGAMLEALDVDSLDSLIDQAVPSSIRSDMPLAMPPPRSEATVRTQLAAMADRNEVYTSMIGMGYYGTETPPVIQRNILENPGWYTAYTPYQPEISQGRLEALLNFQTMIADLTGLPIANASLLDEATAAAEAMTMLRRISKLESDVFFVDADTHPQVINVVNTRAEPLGIKVLVGDPETDLLAANPYGVLLQYPGSSGEVRNFAPLIASIREAGILVAMSADLLALTMVTSPGELGADVAVGSSQRFGVPMMFGGPHAGYLATSETHQRTIPGRLVGVSKDSHDRVAYRLALTTREQHIRREKATSNICTAQVLLAIVAGAYAVYHGPDGLRTIAQRVHRLTSILATGLRNAGIDVMNTTWFDTITVVVDNADDIIARAADRRINLRKVDNHTVGISLDETTTAPFVDAVLEAFGATESTASIDADLAAGWTPLPTSVVRTSSYLMHPVFHAHRTETEMLRYLRRLQGKDIALDRSMIPLGSCTMKLNATTEMMPVTWPGFASMHPFAPLDQATGYLDLIGQLEGWLAELTGYDAVSLQPNAGSQGEYAGLLAIRGYHDSRGEDHRKICLIPSSAHGTNPASAAMAGMTVVVVATDDAGNIDMDDLRAKAEQHSAHLGALMITYPSTHGVFEDTVVEVCELIHAHGGQVYIDGANFNALVGLAKPGHFGGDVSHLNLHKTFTIPHGGGGPGIGPIGVRSHLEPFLPGHSLVSDQAGSRDGVGPVAAAPWGSAGILPIPWAYIALMGGTGLTAASEIAVLSANYMAARLDAYYPVLYKGANGRVAHECILDVRDLKRDYGVSVDDFAKRLVDYGFHAPTMSFPVAGTLMIEPTESESLAEVDRFCDAMIAIRGEVDRVSSGEWPADDNPLVNAPHTAEEVTAEHWDHPYTRAEAAYPVVSLRADKYWPPVSRIDNAFGDRNLTCSCPPIEAYE